MMKPTTGAGDATASAIFNESSNSPIRNHRFHSCQYPNFEEEHAWPLTSSTTCYTGARRRPHHPTTATTTISSSSSSSSRSQDNSSNNNSVTDLRWATAQHTCHVQVSNETGRAKFTSRWIRLRNSDNNVTPSCSGGTTRNEPVQGNNDNNKDPDQWSCVGYSTLSVGPPASCSSTTTSMNTNTTCGWEALAMLNDSIVGAATATVNQPTDERGMPTTKTTAATTSTSTVASPDNDDGSVTVASAAAGQHHHRRNSSFQLSMMSDSNTSINSMTQISFAAESSASILTHGLLPSQPYGSGSSISDPLELRHTNSLVTNEPSSPSKTTTTTTTTMPRVAKLVLRATGAPPTSSQHQGDAWVWFTDEFPDYSTTLDFRPLAVTLMEGPNAVVSPFQHGRRQQQRQRQFHNNSQSTTTTTSIPIIWLGSADHNKLYCYIPIDTANSAAAATLTTTTASSGNTSDEDEVEDEIILGEHDDDDDADVMDQPSLVAVPLGEHPAFVLDTPVMAMDWLAVPVITQDADPTTSNSSSSSTTRYFLAVACQDGTVRLISFQYSRVEETATAESTIRRSTLIPQDVCFKQVIIDGPIVTLSLQQLHPENKSHCSTIHLVVGSLCGYVAELYYKYDPASLSPTTLSSSGDMSLDWEPHGGPFMVAQGFWNTRLEAEDTVLAVHAIRDCVVCGTHLGRVLLYQKKKTTTTTHSSSQQQQQHKYNNYALQWECQLPYPIHAVALMLSTNESDMVDRLAVTTRRSQHVFRRRPQPTSTLGQEQYSMSDDSWDDVVEQVHGRLLVALRQMPESPRDGHPARSNDTTTAITTAAKVVMEPTDNVADTTTTTALNATSATVADEMLETKIAVEIGNPKSEVPIDLEETQSYDSVRGLFVAEEL